MSEFFPSQATADEVGPANQIMELTAGVWIAPALFAVARLGVADAIGDDEGDVDAIAAGAGAHPAALYRTLRALASVGVFWETAKRTFRLTPAGQLLRSDVPGSLRDVVLMPPLGGREMLESVRTGVDSFRRKHGMGLFEYLEQNPESSKIYGKAMTSFSRAEARGLLSAMDLTWASTVVDVGGGHGSLMIDILNRHQHAKGIVYDLPSVVDVARDRVREAGLAERCSCEPGSFFDGVPVGADAYVLASILHDWGDAEALQILKHIRGAIRDDGKVLLIERIVPPGNERSFVKFLDLVMLVSLGGRERTVEEYGALLAQAGLKLEQVHETNFLVAILEGTVSDDARLRADV